MKTTIAAILLLTGVATPVLAGVCNDTPIFQMTQAQIRDCRDMNEFWNRFVQDSRYHPPSQDPPVILRPNTRQDQWVTIIRPNR
jgi:hypothetical protein